MKNLAFAFMMIFSVYGVAEEPLAYMQSLNLKVFTCKVSYVADGGEPLTGAHIRIVWAENVKEATKLLTAALPLHLANYQNGRYTQMSVGLFDPTYKGVQSYVRVTDLSCKEGQHSLP